jgi:UPF0755 protein
MKINFFKIVAIAFLSITIVCLAFILKLSSESDSFPAVPFEYTVPKGGSLYSTTRDMESRGIVQSATFLKIAVILMSFHRTIQAGDYKFDTPESTITIARRLYSGDFRQTKISITIPEGTNVRDMAFIFLKNLPNFNAPYFVKMASKEEGYLYPDTYLFFENVKVDEIIKVMRGNFDKKITTVIDEITVSKKSLGDIVNMASIIEKESNNKTDSKIISGILWKRLDLGMPLQVDAPFYYLTGRTGPFTHKDLQIKSPYNTYLNKGLPAGPITSPSLISIEAALQPTKTTYYYYLTGKDGKMYYADTYEGHLSNKAKYLR